MGLEFGTKSEVGSLVCVWNYSQLELLRSVHYRVLRLGLFLEDRQLIKNKLHEAKAYDNAAGIVELVMFA